MPWSALEFDMKRSKERLIELRSPKFYLRPTSNSSQAGPESNFRRSHRSVAGKQARRLSPVATLLPKLASRWKEPPMSTAERPGKAAIPKPIKHVGNERSTAAGISRLKLRTRQSA